MNCIKGQPSTPLRLWKAAHERSCLHYGKCSEDLRNDSKAGSPALNIVGRRWPRAEVKVVFIVGELRFQRGSIKVDSEEVKSVIA